MRLFPVLMAAALAAVASTAGAADGAGKAVAVVDAANAKGQSGDRVLSVGGEIFVGDTVVTDSIGEAQLLFNDGTRMVVGANSSLVIDQALFRGGASDNKFAVRALGGAFRFISGDSGDKGYSIKTPAATIGVRGTAFDFVVDPETGETKMVLLDGETEMCREDETGKKKECKSVASPCGILQTDKEDKDKVEVVPYSKGRADDIQEEFPYTRSQDKLEEDFRVAGVPCVLGGLAAVGIGAAATKGLAVGVGAIAAGLIAALSNGGSTNSTNATNPPSNGGGSKK